MASVQHCRLLDQGSIHSYAYLLFAVRGGDRGRRMHIMYMRYSEGGRVGGVVLPSPSPRRPERARLTHSVPHLVGSLRTYRWNERHEP